jgi:hypothetical protein
MHFATLTMASSYYRPIEDWNVQLITSMYELFYDLDLCNPDIGGWNVSSVKDFVSELNPYHKQVKPLLPWTLRFLVLFMHVSSFNLKSCTPLLHEHQQV